MCKIKIKATNVFAAHEKENISNKEKGRINFYRSREKVWNEPKHDI